MLVLGIETSCDETSIAVVEDGKDVKSLVVNSQQNLHSEYGGVVPELGARKHIENIGLVYKEALKQAQINPEQIDKIAVTDGPGLSPALNIGISFAKGLSINLNKPLVKVNHVLAHAYALFLSNDGNLPSYPIIVLAVSGGHTQLMTFNSPTQYTIDGYTIDDSVGESFDKVARMLNIEYPGGPIIDKIAKFGDEHSIDFPRPMIDSNNYNFSFSGLKTSVLYYIRDNRLQPTIDQSDSYEDEINRFKTYDIAASFQQAVIDVLVFKTLKLAKSKCIKTIGISGGVAANTRLRDIMLRACQEEGYEFYCPDMKYCTDNAAMVAGLGYHL